MEREAVASISNFSMIPIHRTRNNPIRLRSLDESAIDELMASIKQHGLLQPIMVNRRDNEFEVVFGNHRLEACKRLSWKEIPAKIVEVDEKESLLMQIVENIQRNVRINPVNEARAYRFLMNKGMTLQEIAASIGKSYQYIWSKTRLLDSLHPEILKGLEGNKFRNLTVSHAEQLSLLKDPKMQLQLLRAIEDYGTSVKKLEQMVHEEIFEGASMESSSNKRNHKLPIWKTGQTYFIEETRHCMVSNTTFNTMVDNLGRRARRIGRVAGELRRKRLLEIAEQTLSKREWLVKGFESCGWGKVEIDQRYVRFHEAITRNSFFVMGYLEGLLGIRLKPSGKSLETDYVFEISSPRGENGNVENKSSSCR